MGARAACFFHSILTDVPGWFYWGVQLAFRYGSSRLNQGLVSSGGDIAPKKGWISNQLLSALLLYVGLSENRVYSQ